MIQKGPPLRSCEIFYMSSIPGPKQGMWSASCKSALFVPFSFNMTLMVVLSIWTTRYIIEPVKPYFALMRATKPETAVCKLVILPF